MRAACTLIPDDFNKEERIYVEKQFVGLAENGWIRGLNDMEFEVKEITG